MFNAKEYLIRVGILSDFIRKKAPDFKPQVALVLGSGGTGDFVDQIKQVAVLPYVDLPGFFQTTVPGHAGRLVLARFGRTDVLIFSGRKHLYELGYSPDLYANLKEITLPAYLAHRLGCRLYLATNAAGGLNPNFALGDLMLITSHFDLFFPNPLFGPPLPLPGLDRFQPQHLEYNEACRKMFLEIAREQAMSAFVKEGVYAAVGGPTFESAADCRGLRKLGIDAVGMSTIPEVIAATNLKMQTMGISLITNVVKSDGTNATSHEEVQSALGNPDIKNRFYSLLQEFLKRSHLAR